MNAQEPPEAAWPEYRRYLDHVMTCEECARVPKRCAVGERLNRAYRAAVGRDTGRD
ncbi:hypothetical protein GTW43_14620 [Streptomyces sp. SID5785]|nr:hypothetical protein [Streptomyces sp. SID5785]